MEVCLYEYLPKQAKDIRQQVFVEEQGFCQEFDDIDDIATHVLIFNKNQAVATCRYFYNSSLGSYLVGRIAVLKGMRGKKIGALLMQTAQEEITKKGKREMLVHAQIEAQEFYQKQGFLSLGKEDEEEGHPHIWMKKEW